jgi:hypothetical protein
MSKTSDIAVAYPNQTDSESHAFVDGAFFMRDDGWRIES